MITKISIQPQKTWHNTLYTAYHDISAVVTYTLGVRASANPDGEGITGIDVPDRESRLEKVKTCPSGL